MRFLSDYYLFLSPSEKARRQHENWLNRALRRDSRALRIPTRRVDRGGFGATMSSTEGVIWAEEWWNAAIARAERLDDS
jgi:hypothetical protein